MKIKLGLLYGGKSAEHQVSLQTAFAVMGALDFNKFEVHPIYITIEGKWIRGKQITEKVNDIKKLKLDEEGVCISPISLNSSLFPTEQEDDQTGKLDVIFPLLHGPNGEDGTVQGMLELINIPYVGNGVLGSAAGMDKVIMKNLFAHAGLSQVKYVYFLKSEWKNNTEKIHTMIETELGFPCFIKPANNGSSVGISKCNSRAELHAALEEAFKYDRKVVVEEGIVAREVEVGVLGNDDPKVSVPGEIVPKTDFYDYKAKYEDGNTALIIPAEVTEEEYAQLKEMAIKAFKAIDGCGLVRSDFFLTKDGKAYINEVNTMPGFTPFSMFPLLWGNTGIPYPQLIEQLVQLAIERYEEKQQIKYTF